MATTGTQAMIEIEEVYKQALSQSSHIGALGAVYSAGYEAGFKDGQNAPPAPPPDVPPAP